MTPLRPEPDAGHDGPYPQGAYAADGTFEAAVDQLADPLNDPLPIPGQHTSPWFRDETAPGNGGARGGGPPTAQQGLQQPVETPGEWYDPEGYRRDWYGPQGPDQVPRSGGPVPHGTPGARSAQGAPPLGGPPGGQSAGAPVVPDAVSGSTPPSPRAPRAPAIPDETVVLPVTGPPQADEGDAYDPLDSVPAAEEVPEPAPTGGRAERRRAAKGRGRRRPEPAVPMSRLEARRAARAAKDSPAVVASRVVGEVFITFGVLMLLFVTYQLWWTNVRADQIAGRETHKIQDQWAAGSRTPGAFEPGQGFAIMHIPKLDVVAPIAEGISKEKVLDRGMVGHYAEGTLKTAMPSAKQGNFAVAGHRNTHGEPFRYINKLKPGDPIVVETQDAYYTYEMTGILPQTAPSNVSVIDEVPRGSGFTGPGRYITLTTCTPEFTSTYRMIVWGKMVDERPRSKGKPDALVG
ncbi:class E sortase [Streptomyces sp. NRRL WC-3549]|uniref:class E sortase n=1 Tax=Streptomyces sp. NRRL WC-3549 TaxID=1463925 RepID=UPI0004C73BED|nr:class E sortase [Streptomyces sp. NRRL WC-3549]